jgi:hypothetical protein
VTVSVVTEANLEASATVGTQDLTQLIPRARNRTESLVFADFGALLRSLSLLEGTLLETVKSDLRHSFYKLLSASMSATASVPENRDRRHRTSTLR